MTLYPVLKVGFNESAFSHFANDAGNLCFVSVKRPTIDFQKRDHRNESDSLVSIEVTVILHKSKAVGCSQDRDRPNLTVGPQILWTRKRGLNEIRITHSMEAAKTLQLSEVDGVHPLPLQP